MRVLFVQIPVGWMGAGDEFEFCETQPIPFPDSLASLVRNRFAVGALVILFGRSSAKCSDFRGRADEAWDRLLYLVDDE